MSSAALADGSPGGPPPVFVEAVKDALDHLYDVPRLNGHALARWLLPGGPRRRVSHAQELRERLVDAVQRLNPGHRLPFTARQSRAFRILELRYIEALPYREVMGTLALSQTQYHREQRRAVEMLAVQLWDTLADQEGGAGGRPAGRRDAGLGDRPGEEPDVAGGGAGDGDDVVELRSLLEEVAGLVGGLAAARGARLELSGEGAEVCLATSRTALRNALINVVGYLLALDPGETVTFSWREHPGGARVEVVCRATAGAPAGGPAPPVVERLELGRRLLHAIGGDLRVVRDGAEVTVYLGVPTRRTVLLVVDDNPDMRQLITRFVADRAYTVLQAGTVEDGFALARDARPDVVLLDVVMPHKDGWDALQLLRHHPATAEIPVVVCTILAEPELARALGAAAFLRKPVTRPALLQTLESCLGSAPPPAEAGRPAGPAPRASSGRSSAPPRSPG